MSSPVRLTGIAWDHSRALPPLVATAQRYEETHPGVRIEWRKRTLDEFGHAPIGNLVADFDLVVIDHPWSGYCFSRGLVHDLRPLLPADDLAGLATGCVGESHRSYEWEGKLLALAIDAATPAPSWRPDLMDLAGEAQPESWDDLVGLARRGHAVIPAFNADLFLHFCMLLSALAPESLTDPGEIAPRGAAIDALELLAELTAPMPGKIYSMNPIQVAEWMTTTDDVAYNAFAYTYHNYARPGFSRYPLRFGNLPPLVRGGPRLRSIIGGTGIAISARCQHPETALDYARFVASPEVQNGIYFSAGGQPAALAAWLDPETDRRAGGFFSGTMATQTEAIVRPRYDGYVPIQTEGGILLQEHLRDGRDARSTIDAMDRLYRMSRTSAHSRPPP